MRLNSLLRFVVRATFTSSRINIFIAYFSSVFSNQVAVWCDDLLSLVDLSLSVFLSCQKSLWLFFLRVQLSGWFSTRAQEGVPPKIRNWVLKEENRVRCKTHPNIVEPDRGPWSRGPPRSGVGWWGAASGWGAPPESHSLCVRSYLTRVYVCVYVEYWSEIFYEFSKKLIICLSLSPLVCNHCYETDVTSSDVVPLLAALIHIIHFKLLRISLRRILHIEFDSHYIVMYEWRIWCIHTSDIVFTSKFAFG